jgi:hypothetical protein
MITLGTEHATARQTAAIAAAQAVSLARANAGQMLITAYLGDPGDTDEPVVQWDAGTGAATLDSETGTISLVGPFTAQVLRTGMPAWARITVGALIYLDCAVSDETGDGPLKLHLDGETQLYAGAYCVLPRLDMPA